MPHDKGGKVRNRFTGRATPCLLLVCQVFLHLLPSVAETDSRMQPNHGIASSIKGKVDFLFVYAFTLFFQTKTTIHFLRSYNGLPLPEHHKWKYT